MNEINSEVHVALSFFTHKRIEDMSTFIMVKKLKS